MLASDHRKELGRCFANSRHVKSIAQPGLLALAWDYMDTNFGPTSREEWLAFERRKVAIARQGVTPGYMEFTKSYYLLGQHLCTALSLLE